MPDSQSEKNTPPSLSGGFTERWLRLSSFDFPVPRHGERLPYTLGGMTFVGFLLLFGTGLLMTQFFDPAPERAYRSVETMLAWWPTRFLRSMHVWISDAVVVILICHLSRVVVTGAYKRPRIATWLVGVVLFMTAIFGSYFTGTTLKGDQESLEGIQHLVATLKMFGPAEILLTGIEGQPALEARLYASHIAAFPFLLLGLIAVHFYLIHVFNLAPGAWGQDSARDEMAPERMKGTFRSHQNAILRNSLIYYGAAIVIAAVFPTALGEEAGTAMTGVKPPWPFLWIYGIENEFGLLGIVIGQAALVAILFALPFLDRSPDRNPATRKGILAFAGSLAALIVGLHLYAWIAPAQVHEGLHGDAHRAPHHGAPPPADPVSNDEETAPFDQNGAMHDQAEDEPAPADNHADDHPHEE